MNAVIAQDMRVLGLLLALVVLLGIGATTGLLDDSAEYERRAAWEVECREGGEWVMW